MTPEKEKKNFMHINSKKKVKEKKNLNEAENIPSQSESSLQ